MATLVLKPVKARGIDWKNQLIVRATVYRFHKQMHACLVRLVRECTHCVVADKSSAMFRNEGSGVSFTTRRNANGRSQAAFGGNAALEACAGGAVGILTDGAFCDVSLVAGLPILAASNAVTRLGGRGSLCHKRVETAQLLGTTWHSDDWILGRVRNTTNTPRNRAQYCR